MPNWMATVAPLPTWLSPSAGGLRRKAPQAKTLVANSTSHGTIFAKKLAGVASSSTAPIAPPTRLMTIRARNDRPPAPATDWRPTSPVVT